MARRIRVIEHRRPPSFAGILEDKAREAIRKKKHDEDSSILSITRRDLALTLDHIRQVRALHERLRRNILQHECYLDTEIMQREPRGSQVYYDIRLPERDRLRDHLRELDKERRQLALMEERELRQLHDRLLSLLNRQDQIYR